MLDRVLVRAAEKDGTKLLTLVQDRKLNPEGEVVYTMVDGGVIEVVPKADARLRRREAPNPGPSATDATLLAILQGLGVAKNVLAEESDGMSLCDLSVA